MNDKGRPYYKSAFRRLISSAEIAWVAGVFEGEGHLVNNGKFGIRLRVNMVDEDVIRRLHKITGVGKVYERDLRSESRQLQYVWDVCRRNEVLDVLYKIRPWLGTRRSIRASEAIERMESLKSSE